MVNTTSELRFAQMSLQPHFFTIEPAMLPNHLPPKKLPSRKHPPEKGLSGSWLQ